MTATAVSPVPQGERIEVLDVLRGAAIFGILIANIMVVSGYFFLGAGERAALPTAAADGVAIFLIHALLEGKFYSIFSLLFGYGFAVQMQRAEAKGLDFPPLFRRRLTGLLLIGAAHAFFLWAGDILLLYALLGFLLIPFHRAADRTLVKGVVICLALPLVWYLLLFASGVGRFLVPPEGGAGEGPDIFAMMLAGFQGTSWFEAWRSNLIQFVGRWAELFISMRFPKVFGMFLLGFYLGRRGFGTDMAAARAVLRRAAIAGLTIGLPANLLMAWLQELEVYLPPSGLGVLQVVAASIGVPLLALGYAAALALAYHHGRTRAVLAPLGWAGRMALTNYLMHSLVMVTIFYGIGFGWHGRMGPAATTGLAVIICLAQVVLSRAWLRRYQFGPVEWLWRQFTYRRSVPLRRPLSAA